MNDRRNGRENETANDKALKPDEGTAHNTDPQKNMEGPVSSLMHNTGESFDTEESETEANREKDENM
jgi:hypothetical protein